MSWLFHAFKILFNHSVKSWKSSRIKLRTRTEDKGGLSTPLWLHDTATVVPLPAPKANVYWSEKININFSFSSAEKIEGKVLGRLVSFSCHWGISSSHTKHLIISWRQAPGSERLETHHPQGRLGWESSGSGMRQRGRKSFPGGKNRFLEGGLRKILGCYNGLLFTERPSCINR